MKKLRKPISIILAVIMAISVCAVGFTVFAAEDSVDEKIQNATELTEDLRSAFNALTDAQKDALTPQNQGKIYKLAFEKAKAEGVKEKNVAMQSRIEELLPPTQDYKDAMAMAQRLTSKPKADVIETVLADYNALSNAQKYLIDCAVAASAYAYVGCDPLTYKSGFIPSLDTYNQNGYFAFLMSAVIDLCRTEGVPAKADASVLLTAINEKIDANTTEGYNVESGFAALIKAFETYEKYSKSENLEEQKIAIAAADDMIAERALNDGLNFLTFDSKNGEFYFNGEKKNLSTLLKPYGKSDGSPNGYYLVAVISLRDNVYYEEFTNVLNATQIKKPSEAYNKEILAVKKAYDQMTDGGKAMLTAEQSEKYNKILKLWNLDVSEDQHPPYESEVVTPEMPAPLGDVAYETLAPQLNNLVNSLLPSLIGEGGIQGLLDSYLTNESVTAVAQLIYPALYGVVDDMVGMAGVMNFTPDKVAKQLTGSQFTKTKEQLKELGTSIDDWAKVDEKFPEGIDWGVTDYETFVNAFCNALNGISTSTILGDGITGMLKSLLVGEMPFTPDGTAIDYAGATFGAWDYFIIPLLESLGVSSDKIMTNEEYAFFVQDNGEGKTMYGYLKPLFDILYYDLIPSVSADPVNYLLENLPNLVYHLGDGCLMDGLNTVLDKLVLKLDIGGNVDLKSIVMGLFKDENGNVPSELSLDLIFNMLAPSIQGLGIDLTLDDLLKIGKLGTAAEVDTARMGVASAIKVTGDKTQVTTYLINILNEVLSKVVDLGVHKTFVKQEAPKYPHNGKMDKKVMNTMISGLDGLLSGFVNINELINNGLCTQEMAANAITGIYGLLDSGSMDATVASILGALNLSIKPSDVAAALTEDIYKDLAADLTVDGDTWANVGLVIKNGDKVVDLTNMGFKDGDRDGFINTLAAGLRPLVKALADTGLVTNGEVDGKTVYGLYETLIIPVFEALGITPAADSATFTANYNKLLNRQDAGVAYDYLVKTILSPVLGLIDDLAAAPAATLMKLLPNLAYAIQYNPTLAFVGNLLDGMGGLTGILNGLVQGIATGEDANGNPVYGLANFELPELPLDALASSGTLTEKASKSALHEKYTTVTSDTADTFVTSFYYLYDAINYKDNLKTISGLLAGIDGLDPAISGMIDTILNDVFTRGKEEALCMLGTILAADIWECPDGDGTDGSKTPSTGDYSIPAAAFLLLMVSAGGAILLLKKKKPIAVK